jgi:hypothetical protein
MTSASSRSSSFLEVNNPRPPPVYPSPDQMQGTREIGRFVGHEKQVASQEIFDLLSIPDKLTNQGRILRESPGRI